MLMTRFLPRLKRYIGVYIQFIEKRDIDRNQFRMISMYNAYLWWDTYLKLEELGLMDMDNYADKFISRLLTSLETNIKKNQRIIIPQKTKYCLNKTDVMEITQIDTIKIIQTFKEDFSNELSLIEKEFGNYEVKFGIVITTNINQQC